MPTNRGINLLVTLRIMFLDMLKLRRLPKSRDIPIQMSQPFMQCWVSRPDVTDIALEVLDIDGVEANDGRVETDICLGNGFAEVVRCCMLS